MLITDKSRLENFSAPYRLWQGVPSIAITKKGRIFVAFYTGGTHEGIGNYSLLLKSDDGVHFGEAIAAVYDAAHRAFDPCLWLDPLGRLWFVWAWAPEHAVYASICNDPDAEALSWSEPRVIGADVMMNKPTVLSTGEWLFPMAVWHRSICKGVFLSDKKDEDRRAFAYQTADEGKNFVRLGGADIPKRNCDEHMILERRDGSLAMYIRTTYGIGVSYSYDRGLTWTEGEDSGLGGPNSRFYIGRLQSGRVLLINHHETNTRNNLTALLSEDEGKTWKYKLLLDERFVSYPDACQDENGYIYVVYDYERGCAVKSLKEAYANAREVVYAKFTEEDVIQGALVSEESKLKCTVTRLGRYAREQENPYDEENFAGKKD